MKTLKQIYEIKKRKNFLAVMILFSFIFLCSATIKAQSDFHFGPRFGLGESTISGQGLNNMQGKLVINGGVTGCYQFNRVIGLETEFLVTSKGALYSGFDSQQDVFGTYHNYNYSGKYNLIYGELPAMLKLSFGSENFRIKVFAGPGINFKFFALDTKQYDDANFNSNHGYVNSDMKNINVVEYGFTSGIGIDAVTKDKSIFFIDARATRGMSSFGTINGVKAINDYFSIGAGYQF